MSKYISILLLVFIFSACGDTPQIENSRPNNPNQVPKPVETDYYVSPASSGCKMTFSVESGSGPRSYLGHGYDITGAYLSLASVKPSVIDLNKLSDDEITTLDAPASSSGDRFSGIDASDFLSTLMAHIGARPNDNIYYFARTIKNASSNSSIQMQMQWIRSVIMGFPATTIRLQENVSDEFKADILRLTPRGLVEKYGTHIITRAVTGSAIRSTYSVYLPGNRNDFSALLNEGFDAAEAAMTGSLNASLPDKLASLYNYGARLDMTFLGGVSSKIGFVEESQEIRGISEWWESASYNNSALISLDENDIVPLSAAVADKDLAYNIDRAIASYVRDSWSDLPTLIPLFQNSNGEIYRYVTSALESSTFDKSGIYSYGVLGALSEKMSADAPKPLYTHIDAEGNQILSLIQPSKDWERIGYVMAELNDDCVPLYEISDGSRYAYTIEAANSLGSLGQWHPTGAVFYLLRP